MTRTKAPDFIHDALQAVTIALGQVRAIQRTAYKAAVIPHGPLSDDELDDSYVAEFAMHASIVCSTSVAAASFS